ncbi:dTDP-4-dehydrorhamnose 3,5-epimerase [Patescibacteria group bacterium]|nr:dTDP-4-dehydrorhamnose 3,5-epimerase [Patescibacteria group bacterium]
MKISETNIKGLVVIQPDVFGDDRGFFFESYNFDKFKEIGIDKVFVQDNHSKSAKGVLRGLHFQMPPKPMAKLVRCTRGKVWDVAVDLRKDSATYLQWFGVELSEENKKMFFIPEGFAHGFYALEDSEFLYKCSNTYDSELDASVRYNDEAFSVEWPLDGEPILSDKDKTAPSFALLNLNF